MTRQEPTPISKITQNVPITTREGTLLNNTEANVQKINIQNVQDFDAKTIQQKIVDR